MAIIQHKLLDSHPAYAGCRAESSYFSSPDSEREDWMLMLHVTDAKRADFTTQLNSLLAAREQFMSEHPDVQPVFSRVFLSDAANQEILARDILPEDMGALSIIEQPPLDGTRVALWLYFQTGITRHYTTGGVLLCEHDGYQHIWTASARKEEGDALQQSQSLFEEYSLLLERYHATLYDHAIRTWLFVQNVDVNYAGVVLGRNKHFDEKGLTSDTHFISSTGIQGRSQITSSLVQLDAYAVRGVAPEHVQFLYAPSHLNPTHEYGVRFERGTTVHLRDRSYSYISGTASIDNKGNVLHVGDIVAQTKRMWENVEMLLSEANTGLKDAAQILVYLRDLSDYEVVKEMFDAQFPAVPTLILLAPVCRPTWLIEMECICIHHKR